MSSKTTVSEMLLEIKTFFMELDFSRCDGTAISNNVYSIHVALVTT